MNTKPKKNTTQSRNSITSKGRVKVKDLALHKETIQNLSEGNSEAVKGGAVWFTHPGGAAVAACQ